MNKVSTIIFKIAIVCALITTSCNKNDKPIPTPDHPYGEGYGEHVFWCSGQNMQYPIRVLVTDKKGKQVKLSGLAHDSIVFNGYSTSDYCNDKHRPLEFTSIIDTAGDYSYTATSKDSFAWVGKFTIYADNCHSTELNGSFDMGIGYWKKKQNGSQDNSAGVVIFWNGATGTVTANPNNSCLTVGTIVLKNLNALTGSIDYLNCQGSFTHGTLTDVKAFSFFLDTIEYDKQ